VTIMSRVANLKPGEALPERAFEVDNVQLFFYNAALWNAHRIHFDYPYATEVEGYPGLVIAGPLMGDWLGQCVLEWLDGEGELESLEYRNRMAAYVGETLYSGGSVLAADPEQGTAELELFVKNENGDVLLPGAAVVRFNAGP